MSTASSPFRIDERGARNSFEYRIFYRDNSGKVISPWHDIPMFADEKRRIYNMVCEIPRWTNEKMEIATDEPLNPIKHDTKGKSLRYVPNLFPHHGYMWNYGAIPQTWENSNHKYKETGAAGDNDPIDVIEIGSRIAKRGDVLQVKVIGVLGVVDEGETDWKLIAIAVNDPEVDRLNDADDISKVKPGLIKESVRWFRDYKIPDGKKANTIAFEGKVQSRKFAEEKIVESHNFWKDLIHGKTSKSGLFLSNTSLQDNHSITHSKAENFVAKTKETSKLSHLEFEEPLKLEKIYFI